MMTEWIRDGKEILEKQGKSHQILRVARVTTTNKKINL